MLTVGYCLKSPRPPKLLIYWQIPGMALSKFCFKKHLSFLNAGKAAPAAFYELKLVFGNYFDKLSESQEISDTTHVTQ